jgi:hypothetical protein
MAVTLLRKIHFTHLLTTRTDNGMRHEFTRTANKSGRKGPNAASGTDP